VKAITIEDAKNAGYNLVPSRHVADTTSQILRPIPTILQERAALQKRAAALDTDLAAAFSQLGFAKK